MSRPPSSAEAGASEKPGSTAAATVAPDAAPDSEETKEALLAQIEKRKAEIEKYRLCRETAEARLRDQELEAPLRRALEDRKCSNADAVLLYLKAQNLVRVDAGGKLVGLLKSGKEIAIDELAESVRIDLIPELFPWRSRAKGREAGAEISPTERLRRRIGGIR